VLRVREAACWAHRRARRGARTGAALPASLRDVQTATDSPVAREALKRIGALCDVETAINSHRD